MKLEIVFVEHNAPNICLPLRCSVALGAFFGCKERRMSLVIKSEISHLKPSSVAMPAGLCVTESETTKKGFIVTRGPFDLDVLEYAGVLRKSSLNQVTQISWSTRLVNQVSDSKKENKNRSEKIWKGIHSHYLNWIKLIYYFQYSNFVFT